MYKKKKTIRRTNSADTFPNPEEYDKQRNMLGLPGHQPHELSALAETPSYYTSLNDLKEGRQLYAPTPSRPLPDLSNVLNLPPPGQYTQSTRHDGEGLPPPPSLKKSSSRKLKKEPSLFEPLKISTGKQPYSSATQTFMETRKIKPKSKSKGGKNKTKKRKAKKTKKNKKNKK